MRVVGNTVMVTAADVSEPHTVTVIAQAGKDVAPCEYKLTVNPKAKLVELFQITDSGPVDLSESPWLSLIHI